MSMMGRVKYEILHIQTAEVFGRICEGDPEYVSKELIWATSLISIA